MALLNKLFNSRPKIPTKLQDNVCLQGTIITFEENSVVIAGTCSICRGRFMTFYIVSYSLTKRDTNRKCLLTIKNWFEEPLKQERNGDKMCTLDAEQVRLVLFCECDFRGRKLLFDSHAIDRIRLPETPAKRMSASTGSVNTMADVARNMKKYTEVSDEHGYIYTKPNADIYQLGEMIFGSVAMSYRGTTYKIHHLATPMRIMCTQVFPSPRHSHRFVRQCNGKIPPPNNTVSSDSNILSNGHIVSVPSCTNLERSVRLHHRNDGDDCDSGANSSFATSSGSRGQPPLLSTTASDTLLFCRSTPLSVPQMASESDYRHSIGDSGITNSFTSFGNACTQSVPLNLNVVNPYVTTFSNGSLYRRWLRSTSMSLEHSSSSLVGSYSADDIRSKPVGSNRSSKLGLAIIISLPVGQEEFLERFLMEHATLIESMVCRARISIEAAYRRRRNFVAQLYNTAVDTARWLSDVLTYGTNNHCDYSFNSELPIEHCHLSNGFGGLAFAGLSNLLRTDWDWDFRVGGNRGVNSRGREIGKSNSMTSSAAEGCIRDLCELLEAIDAKDTNFFVSTFVTAVLTHHLGWVATALPASADAEHSALSHLRSPGNPLWGQLTDLYGAIGCPTKIAHTIITGSPHNRTAKSSLSQSEIIAKLLNSVTYFIRCCDIKRNCVSRGDIKAENETADDLCQKAGCIPEENYKKYQDHLQEMQESNLKVNKVVDRTRKTLGGIKKSFSCLNTLTCDKNSDLKSGFFERMNVKNDDIENVFSERKDIEEVVFVLGESDELVGLKSQDEHLAEASENTETYPFKDSDFSYVNPTSTVLKKSLSQTDLSVLGEASSSDATSRKKLTPTEFVRAQSVPPDLPNKESETPIKEKNTPKYKYSGVKFNFQQYPQIVANYMRSKNIELSNLQFLEKAQLAPSVFTAYDFTKYEVEDDFELEALQTPSNATDLEFSADQEDVHKEVKTDKVKLNSGNTVSNGLKCKKETDHQSLPATTPSRLIKIVELPMPQSVDVPTDSSTIFTSAPIGFTHTLLQSKVRDHYIADLVLQGTSAPRAHWESALRQDLATAIQHPLLDQPADEAIAIIANIDTWEVQLMSSRTYVVEKGSNGVTIGMSQLVANMLESLLHMWKLQTPAEYCLLHIEEKLQEFCIRSKALAELLLATEFCTIDILTSALQLEVNDIPLLMSIASTHSPHIMQKYGLSFQ